MQDFIRETLLESGPEDVRLIAIRSIDVATQQQRSTHAAREAADWAKCPVTSVQISRARSGRPSLSIAGRCAYLSLSRRDDGLLIGLAHGPIGVDWEPVEKAQEPPWEILPRAEQTVLRAIADPSERHRHFLRLWTVKEAVLKAQGLGLRREPDTVEVSVWDDEAVEVRVAGEHLRLRFAACGVRDLGSGPFVWACVLL